MYDITQDSKGFMWFATDEGICRYDGKKFESFTNSKQNSKSGSCLIEDRFGRMWYSNFDGNLFYVENNILKSFTKNRASGYCKFGIIDKYLFLIEKNNISVFDIISFKLIKKIPIVSYTGIISHCSDENYYVFANKKLLILSKKLKLKAIELPKEMKESFPKTQNIKNKLVLVSNGKITSNNILTAPYLYVYESNHFKKIPINKHSDSSIQNLSATSDEAWICTTTGAYQFKNNITNPKCFFQEQNITTIFKDRSEQYWFGTASNGLLLSPKLNDQFLNTDHAINQVEISGNQLFYGTSDDQIFQYSLDDKKTKAVYKGKTNHDIGVLKVDSDNQKILFSSLNFITLSNYKNIHSEDFIAIKDLTKIDQTYYSFSASGVCGILKTSEHKSTWDSFYQQLNNDENLSNSKLKRILPAGRGKATAYNPVNKSIYFATNEGLFVVTKNGTQKFHFNNFVNLKNYKDKIIALNSNNEIFYIDNQNNFSKWNYLSYTNNEIVKKIQIVDKSLFLFTNLSVFEYDFSEKKAKKVLIQNPEFEIKDVTASNNQLFFASSKGIIKIDKNKTADAQPAKIILNHILVNDSKIAPSKRIFESDENTFTIDFSVLSYIPNQKNEVYYKINEQAWKIVEEDSRQLLLNSLASGTYDISIKTIKNNQASAPVTLHFVILQPLWWRWWFLLLMGGALSLGIYWIYLWQIQKIKLRNQLIIDKINLEKNANQSKLKAIKSQMNPHFFYNALNTIQSYILSNEKKQALTYLAKFSSLTRTILEMTEKDWVSISEEIKALRLYLDIEQARFEEDFEYTILTTEALDTDNIKIPSILLQPYVENAIKHGLLHKSGQKNLTISFEKKNTELHIVIDDNGIGREKSQALNSIKNKKHKSFATQATQNRIALLNQNHPQDISLIYIDKTNEAGFPLGTTVIIKLPIQ